MQLLDVAAGKTRDELRIQCEIETRYPFTMNENHLVRAQVKKSEQIADILFPAPTNVSAAAMKEVLEKLGSIDGFPVTSSEELSRKLRVPSNYTKELDVISGALAYFEIASQRMIDIVPMRIEQHLVYDFSKSVQEKLEDTLRLTGNGGEERCAVLAVDNPDIELKRNSLHKQREILVKADEILGFI